MVIEVDKIKKHYKEFDLDCSLQINEGCITGLIGQNGAGKSTTFKAILNLLRTDGGAVRVFGKDSRKLLPEDKERIGVVLADSGFSEYFKIKDVVKIMEKLYKKFDKEKFLSQCEKQKLPADKELQTFSNGMKAKFKILAAMSYGADVLILDEPTAGLDVVARDEILGLLREYMEEGERSVLISSHISSDLETLCDDIYMIHEGRIVFHEETDTILSEYGVLKVDEETYRKLDKSYIICVRKEPFGYSCLTNEKRYYMENYPDIVAEKGTIDEVIMLTIKGERIC